MKAKSVGKKDVAVAKAVPSVYREGQPAFLWTNSAFYLTQVVGVVGCRVAKPFRRLFNFETKLRLSELDREMRRDMVDAAKAVMTAKSGVAEKAVADGLARAFNMPVVHVLEYKVVAQAARELADEPKALAAVRKHLEMGGELASKPRELAELVMDTVKPEVGLAALSAACFKLRDELKPHLEKKAEAIIRAYVEVDVKGKGAKFVPKAKELAQLVMDAKKPAVDFFTLAGAAYKLIPAYRDEFREQEAAGIDEILKNRMGSSEKSGATIGDLQKYQKDSRRQDRPRHKGGYRRGEGEEDEEGRGRKSRKK
ncbi:MAG: hypothetical protein HY813_03005 [Candidatus Portnoybacteria bacterium]|nr:hypothetical protein [Candidatus Portnoybacteria bacterium]